MATISAIEKQRRRRRVDVHLDGAYAFSLSLELVVENGLAVGQEVAAARRRALEAEDGRRGAMAAALRLISMRPRSERDLRDRLRRRGFESVAADAAVARMRELGYLDDEAYARLFVESRQAATPRSRRALTFELSRKGVDREQAGAAVEAVSDEEAAYEAAQRRLRSLRGLDLVTFRRRLGAFLASRGFGYGVVRTTLDRVKTEAAEGGVEDEAAAEG